MNYGNIFEQALGIREPWYISDVKFSAEEKRLDIFINFKKGAKFSFSKDDKEEYSAYDTREKTWRHLNFFEYECFLHARIPRIRNKEGKTKVIKAPWEGRLNGFTLLFEALILQLTFCMPVAQISRLIKVSDDKIWRLLEKYVLDAYEVETLENINQIGIDETSSRKRHDYITLFVDLIKKKTVYVTDGRSADTVQEFKEVLEIKGGKVEEIKEVSCDMSPAFIKGVENSFPDAEITFDRFHVMKIVNEALDEIRRREVSGQKKLKGTRYLFLKNYGELTQQEKQKIEELTMDEALINTSQAYRYKELFRDIYNSETMEEFETKLKKWSDSVMSSNLEPMKKAVNTIKRHWNGIVNWMKTHINNGILEGTNSVIQAIKSRARGYRTKKNFIIMVYLVTGKLDFKPFNKHYSPI